MLALLRKVSDGLNLIAEYAVAALMAVMIVVVAAQVFFRYVVFYPLSWSEELSRYVLIWVTFLGASAGIKRKAHFGVQAATYFLPPRFRQTLTMVIYLLALGVFLVMIYFGWQNVLVTSRQRSPAMELPMDYVYLAVPLTGFLMLIHTLTDFLDTLLHGEVAEGHGQTFMVDGGAVE